MDSLETAIRLHRQGRADQAEQAYREILAVDPNHAGALHLLAVIRHQEGRHEEALALMGRAIAINSGKAVYHNNYGAVLMSLQRFAEARRSFATALKLSPQYADALANLGLALAAWQEGEKNTPSPPAPLPEGEGSKQPSPPARLPEGEGSEACYRCALAIDPRHRDARKRLANLLHELGKSDEAVGVLQTACAAFPTAAAWVELGDLCMRIGHAEDAKEAYRKAVELEPNHAAAHFKLGQALDELRDMAAAERCFDRAAQLRSDKPWWRLARRFARRSCLEAMWRLSNTARGWREALSEFKSDLPSPPAPLPVVEGRIAPSPPALLPEVEGSTKADGTGTLPATFSDILEAGAFPTFGLSYLGRKTRRLKEQFAAVYEPYFRDQPRGKGDSPIFADTKIGTVPRRRIGFLVTRRHEGIFARCMSGLLRYLNRDRFEIVVLAPRASVEPLKRHLWNDRLRYVPFADSFLAAALKVREAACDLLYYWEVGSDALNYFLPFARLAPVQCTSHGSLTTTGVPAIDYFFSSSLIESEDAVEHYSERLWQSRTLLMCQERLPPVSPA